MDDNSIQLYKKALDAGMEKVYNIRVMVVGQFGVGKTTLIKRLLGQKVDISESKSTEGIDVHKHCSKISLDKGEWTQQHDDSDQLYTLHRLNKLLSVPDQKTDINQEQDDFVEIIYLREITSEIDATKISSQLYITMGAEIHHVEHSDKARGIAAVSRSDPTPSDSEKTKDAMRKIIRLVNENADKLVKDIEKYAALSIWDFAGQFAFYTTHQMFLTSRAIYLLVIDLSQQITDLIQDDKCFFDADGIKLRPVLDLIQIWMNSIHSSVPSPDAIVPVILVGTHVDKLSEKSRKEVIDKYFKEVRYMLREKPTIRHLMDDIAIDNTQPDPMLEELKKRIFEVSSQQPHWGEERPARWLPLEQAIMTLKTSGTKIVSLSLIEEINMSGSVKIEDRDELELFLKFHHAMGTILYFSVEDLREKIVLDPQWMIDALKSLITAETFIKKNPAITSKLYEFIKTGKLTHELIDVVWSKENNPEFHDNKDHILRLMEQLNIIAIPRIYSEEGAETKEEHYFLAPCMLQQETPEEIISPKPNTQMESSPALCYVFTGNFLPSAIFHRLVAACIAHWPVAKKKKEHIEENLIFCGCCIFQLDKQHKLTLHFREHVIFLRVTRMGIKDKTPSSKLCIEMREFITRNLLKIIGYLGQGLKFEYFIQCPEYNGVSINSLIPVSELKEESEVPCEFDDHHHVIESYAVLDFWFDDQQKIDSMEDTCLSKSNQTMPEECLTSVQKRALPPRTKYHAFFSYASPDIRWVKKIVEKLEKDHGYICCEYDRDNTPGTPLIQFADDSIRHAYKTVLVMTKNAFQSGFVLHEIQMAMTHACNEKRKYIVPVLVEDCDIPGYLKVLNYVDARDNSKSNIWWPKLLMELAFEGGQVISMSCSYIFLINRMHIIVRSRLSGELQYHYSSIFAV
ncbi:hypothetical protein ACJMK2_000342 [Sinanodonta woodiana]|uniref:non-specific serine/threonine protein kinase n=1 Tax=Sinanodonta woodiana TaxID=1069815 RepID=A0ABD3XNY9_SINWO